MSVSQNTTLPENFYLSEEEGAVVGGIIAIGALIAAIPVGFLADKFGRKLIIIGVASSFLFGWIFIILASNATMLIIGRFFSGMGTGATCLVGSLYIHEISQQSIRGILGSLTNLFLTIGILLTSIIGSFTSWRVLSTILGLIPLIFGIIFIFMPESPVYLIRKKDLKNAELVLLKLRGKDYDVQEEIKAIQKEIFLLQQNSSSIKDIFSNKFNRRALISVVGVLTFQQLCGINVIVFYTVPIFEAAGSSIPANWAGMIISSVQLLSAYVALFIIEKAPRRFYLIVSSAGMFLFMITLGMYFQLKQLNIDTYYIDFIPITSAIIFMICFSFGYGPIPWLLMGELISPEIKGIGNGAATAANWTSAFLVAFTFPIISAHVGFYICAVAAAIASVFVYFLVPETRGLSLIEVRDRFNNK